MIDEDEVGFKEKLEIRPEKHRDERGQSNLIPTLPILGLRTRYRCVMSEGTQRVCEMSRPGGSYNRVLKCGSPQTQGGGVQGCLT